MRYLETLTVKGFLSIRNKTLNLARLNVLIGANGAGKSNLFQVFHLLQNIAAGKLQLYIGKKGGADQILHYGSRQTTALEVNLVFKEGSHVNKYMVRLVPTDRDTLVFEKEAVIFQNTQEFQTPVKQSFGSGHAESQLNDASRVISKWLRTRLNNIHVYQFNDTGPTSRIRKSCDIEDNRTLHHDGRNLSAYLYLLEQNFPSNFKRIERAVRRIAPFFDTFCLGPSRLNPKVIQLEWTDIHNETHFGASALPDGLLRFICLATVLNQPHLPALVVLDEPELGLHPAAITYLAELLRTRAQECQILAATQSVTLVNQLEPDNVWVTDREGGESTFKHLADENLDPWLEAYAIGDIWEKNLIGGRP
ncbi:MAG: AAA family ATPase [Caldilineaceae bacterium SB0661_bin_34]|nr:AAA family ATPase [Caldilineaceae bacterium SB0661_bin_34]